MTAKHNDTRSPMQRVLREELRNLAIVGGIVVAVIIYRVVT